MDWNIRPLQNADAKNHLRSEERYYNHLVPNTHAFPQTNAYSSNNACTYAGNNQVVYQPTSNAAFLLVNDERFKTSDQALPGASVSVDRRPLCCVPVTQKPPNPTSRIWAEMNQTSLPKSDAYFYSHSDLPPMCSESNAGNNVRNVPWEFQYATTSSYAVQPQIQQHNSMRTQTLYQSHINSQNNSMSLGTSGQHVQNKIYHPNTQFKVLNSLNQNMEPNVQLLHCRPSQMGSEAPSGCYVPSLLPANCDSSAAAQSSVGVPQAAQNMPNGYSRSQLQRPSDPKNASGCNSGQQHCQKQQSGDVSQSVRNVCNSSGNMAASQPFNEMPVPSRGVSKELCNVVQEMETLYSMAASKPLTDPASVQEGQTSSLMNGPVNSQLFSAAAQERTTAKDRLDQEAQKLLTIKKKYVLLEKIHQYKRKLLEGSEHDKSIPQFHPPSYYDTLNNLLPWTSNQNVLPSPPETVRTECPILNSSLEESSDKNAASADNRGLQVTQSNPQVEQGNLSSSSTSIPSQSKLSAQLHNSESTPISKQRDTYGLASSQKPVTSLTNASCSSQVDKSVKSAPKKVPASSRNSSLLRFILNSTDVLTDETISATFDKILKSSLCSEKTQLDSSVSDGSLQKDTNVKVENLQDKQVFKVHMSNTGVIPVSETTKSGEAKLQSDVDHKKTPLTGNESFKQSNDSYSVEELTPCPGSLRKHPSESVRVQNSQSNESPTANQISPYSQNTKNREQNNVLVSTDEANLPVTTASVGQKPDTLSSNLIKGFEPQVAVVSPLVLSEQRAQSEQTDKCLTSAAKTCPVIDSESTYSFQEEDKNGLNFSSKILQVDVQDHKDKQVTLKTGNKSIVVLEEQMFCISTVCTLVEGDRFYNPQIANIFRSVPETHALNGTSSEQNPSDPGQKEQQLDLCKNELSSNAVQGETLPQKMLQDSSSCMSKAVKTLDGIITSHLEKESSGSPLKTISTSKKSKSLNASLKHPENDWEILASINQELAKNSLDFSINVAAEMNAINVPRDSIKENYISSKNSTVEEMNLFGAQPIKCLNNQLSELVKEFPYGIEGGSALMKEPVKNDSVAEQIKNQPQKENQICDKNSHLKDPVDLMKIVVLSSNQNQELFPEHNLNSSSDGKGVVSWQSEKASAEKSLEGSVQPGQSLCEQANKTQKISKPREKKKDCSIRSLLCEAPKTPQYPCKREMCVSEENYQLSKAVNTSFVEGQENDSKSDAIMKDISAEGNLPFSEEIPNNVSKNEDICRSTSVMNKDVRLKVDDECKPLTTQPEKVGPLPSSENQEADKFKSSSWKEELQIDRETPLLNNELNSDKKEHKTTSEELSEKTADCTDGDNTTKSSGKILIKMESLSKDETKMHLAMESNADVHKFIKSEAVEVKHAEINQGQKIKTSNENTAKEQNCRKQKQILGQDVGVNIKENAKLSAGVKHKKQNSCHADAIKLPNFGTVDIRNAKYSQHESMKALPSQEPSYKRKRKQNVIGNRKPKKTKVEEERLKQSEAKKSEQLSYNHMINTDKAKKLNGENGWKLKSSLADCSVLKRQRKRARSSTVSKNYFSTKERHLDGQNKDKCCEKMFPDKNMLYLNRRNNRLKIHLQKEPKKHYLNRVAFRRTTQERIYLTKLETSPVRPTWHLKHKVSHNSGARDAFVSEAEKPCNVDVLEFKLYPEILFRNPTTDEERLAVKNPLEREKAIVAGVKSKREDWLKCDPVKQIKLEEFCTAEGSIPLDTAMQILDGDGEALRSPIKDSKEMFQTYKKMYLEKKMQKP
ncbi:retroelement silencing factor 1 [Melopsittacus undulatus]|uniref:Uncharacterized protein n=1 Tax=Melopsittacus undulatus TaxID=13146 RepID=A0A8C6J9S8_MELUD|nr:retroelement silencing factor 1 [Melopsittacus undulatus]